MANGFTLKDFEQADSELRAAQARRYFYIHTLLYAIVNIVLVVLNLVVSTAFPWAIFPVIIWGIGLGAHYMLAIRWIDRENAQWMSNAEYLAGELHRANKMPLEKTV